MWHKSGTHRLIWSSIQAQALKLKAWVKQVCAGVQEANRDLRLSSTTSPTSILDTYSSSMSHLTPSTSSFQSTEGISRGGMGGESERQR